MKKIIKQALGCLALSMCIMSAHADKIRFVEDGPAPDPATLKRLGLDRKSPALLIKPAPKSAKLAGKSSQLVFKSPQRSKKQVEQEAQLPRFDGKLPQLDSNIALIFDEKTQKLLYQKNAQMVAPIASITKLMTAMVVLDAKLPMDKRVSVDTADVDVLKGTHSRLSVGLTFKRSELMKLALMSSENRAAAALARTYPGGRKAAIAAMNAKAKELGMQNTYFRDPTGLNSDNVSTARDLVKMVAAARKYGTIRQFTTTSSHTVNAKAGKELMFNNTNPLVRSDSWDIGVSKTGFISEAGRCLVMEARINKRPVIIVLLDSQGKTARIEDARRIKRWMEASNVGAGPSVRKG
ncbi:MAG: D-alanyl-D-alanine endopeptidase [Gallionella sp.]|nr:D-alanyl-D-alanine endopeptidase [Gallionella sp.]